MTGPAFACCTASLPLDSRRRLSLMFLVMAVIRFLHRLFLFRFGGGAETCLQIVLDCGRELIHVGKEHRDFPHIVVGQSLIPGGHTGVTDSGANGVENVPLRIVGWIGNEIWWRRIEGRRESRGLVVEASVTERTIHRVELDAIF